MIVPWQSEIHYKKSMIHSSVFEVCPNGAHNNKQYNKESSRKSNKTMVFHKEMYYNIESVRMHAYYIHK